MRTVKKMVLTGRELCGVQRVAFVAIQVGAAVEGEKYRTALFGGVIYLEISRYFMACHSLQGYANKTPENANWIFSWRYLLRLAVLPKMDAIIP